MQNEHSSDLPRAEQIAWWHRWHEDAENSPCFLYYPESGEVEAFQHREDRDDEINRIEGRARYEKFDEPDDLPPAPRPDFTKPLANIDEGKAFIAELIDTDLLFHFEDDPAECGNHVAERWVNTFTPEEVPHVRARVAELYSFEWGEHECPIGYALHLDPNTLPPARVESVWIPKGGDLRGAVTVIGHKVEIAPRGGGFGGSMRLPDFLKKFRRATEEELTKPPLSPAFFFFDDGPSLVGITDGSRWNGWGDPFVPVVTLRKWIEAAGEYALQDSGKALFEMRDDGVVVCNAYEDEPEEIQVAEVPFNGKTIRGYHLGCGLCWNQIDLDTVANDDVPEDCVDDVEKALSCADLPHPIHPLPSCPHCRGDGCEKCAGTGLTESDADIKGIRNR